MTGMRGGSRRGATAGAVGCERPRSRTRQGIAWVLTLGLGLATLGLPSAALAQTAMHEIVWAHQAPGDVQRFVIFVSPVQGNESLARQVDVGMPPGSDQGSLRYFSAIVPVALDEYVAVAAVGSDGSLSPLSAWSGLPPTQPGQPLLIP